MHHQTVQRCIERAAAFGPLAALDDSARPGKTALGDEREVPNNAPNGRNSIVEGRPIPPKLELRPLTTLSRADLQEATTMLTYAFDEHPLFQLAFPKVASRSKILQTLFTTVLKDAIRFGRVEVACSHKIVGMLIWYPPGCYPMPNSRILRLLPHYARLVAVSPVGLMKLFRAQTTLNRFRPKQPHCHGYSGWKTGRACRHRSCQASVERSRRQRLANLSGDTGAQVRQFVCSSRL